MMFSTRDMGFRYDYCGDCGGYTPGIRGGFCPACRQRNREWKAKERADILKWREEHPEEWAEQKKAIRAMKRKAAAEKKAEAENTTKGGL